MLFLFDTNRMRESEQSPFRRLVRGAGKIRRETRDGRDIDQGPDPRSRIKGSTASVM